ncbi:hypothetical protein [Microbacterium sp. HSID17254]|uniref:hypothetical protein n=1 Tax=Microbacterium sp. HSID17254 TaxID=2419509 RepID=UPI000F86414C|nr:hypothetical protein [Microbacterium sp. HSID17254]
MSRARSGWVGEHSRPQPAVGDRLRSVLHDSSGTTFQRAERITRIDHNDGATTYTLACAATIIAPEGARIFWEDQ